MTITTQYLDTLLFEFQRIKKLGYIPATRNGSTAIGKTFEDNLGKREDNFPGPDFEDIEIKTQRELSNSYITLFTKAPDYPRKANTYLRENYGYPLVEYNNMNILHTSLFGNSLNNMNLGVVVDRIQEKVFIVSGVERIAYYTFANLYEKFHLKLRNLAVVSALAQNNNGLEYFYYDTLNFYYNPSFERFLTLLENGQIMVDIRIGVYHNSEKANYGKTHDHGTGFRIKAINLLSLYENYISVQ